MARPHSVPNFSLAIVTSGDPEVAQARYWRPISDHWPAFSTPPQIYFVRFDDDAIEEKLTAAEAVLILDAHAEHPTTVQLLLDRLGDGLTPAVIIADEPGRFARQNSESAFALHPDTPAPVVAATLAAALCRQHAVRSLEDEARLLRRFQGGMRVEMEKLQDELQLASSVQREFLPKTLPAVPNIDFHVLFRPCGYVSGDIYDVQRLDEHHVGFFLADAVGHGVPAALMTMVIARGITMKVITNDGYRLLRPAEVLSRLNEEMIARHGNGSRFSTAVYGIIDCRTREVTLAGAGHPPPLRLAVSDHPEDASNVETTKVETSGGLLGIFPGAEYDEATFTLGDNEMLLIHSDGFETAFPVVGVDAKQRRLPNHHFVDHFTRLARAWNRGGMNGALHDLANEIDKQSGSLHQLDDLTALAIVPSRVNALDHLFTGAADENAPVEYPHERAQQIYV
ncbi:MAG TPA: SpoIIE family protein phosphatase [Phycisphaerales bacterium]|nr:SpoIIE family protein phosphatase [Phycisphaerales bacterium]